MIEGMEQMAEEYAEAHAYRAINEVLEGLAQAVRGLDHLSESAYVGDEVRNGVHVMADKLPEGARKAYEALPAAFSNRLDRVLWDLARGMGCESLDASIAVMNGWRAERPTA